MSGQSMWLWIGVVVLIAGLGVLYWYNLRKRG
jgi:LPXTG-motif cell wall-anchored protein